MEYCILVYTENTHEWIYRVDENITHLGVLRYSMDINVMDIRNKLGMKNI